MFLASITHIDTLAMMLALGSGVASRHGAGFGHVNHGTLVPSLAHAEFLAAKTSEIGAFAALWCTFTPAAIALSTWLWRVKIEPEGPW